MPDFTIGSVSMKGNFELHDQHGTLLYTAQYKNWFSGDALAHFNDNDYTVKPANFWQTEFEAWKGDHKIGKIAFNWKGQIIIAYTGTQEKEFVFEYKGLWKFRFV